MLTPAAEIAPPNSSTRRALFGYFLAIAQLTLIIGVVAHYRIDSPALNPVLTLAGIGCILRIIAPAAYRVPAFVVLSFCGIFLILGLRDGAWLIAVGMLLIGVCRLPVSLFYRVLALIFCGALLALLRVEYGYSPWSYALWPVLASMFMFRPMLYVRATSSGRVGAGTWDILAYFFMLPNLAFSLFPVIDYQAFRQSYSSKNEREIYQRGVLWISRGIVHLLLYRLIYANFIDDPTEVVTLGDLVQFMVCTFLLYLRVSGQFHIAVGVLHLFGFSLPETNRLYLLSSGFTDMWRRMNIYWTDFMTKVVFYPTYFRIKRIGPALATSISTAVVFLVTWLLHSYQWFWLRGDFPLRLQDALFWGVLGALVIRGVLREMNSEPARKSSSVWNWSVGIRAAATFSVICFLWSLWSVPSLAGWVWMLSAALKVDEKGIVLLSITLATVMLLSMWVHAPSTQHESRLMRISLLPPIRSTVSILIVIMAALPAVRGMVPPAVASVLKSVQTERLNPRDNVVQSRGYYEQLNAIGAADEPEEGGSERKIESWRLAKNDCRWQLRQNLLLWDLAPSLDLTRQGCWTQRIMFSTNSWGMRDKEYTTAKPPDTMRVEIFGASQVMGEGTTDAGTFEQIVEDRLNSEAACGSYRHFQVMNFGVDAYTVIQQLALLDDKGFNFSPDVVIFTVRGIERLWTPYYISEVARHHIEIPYQPLKVLFQKEGLQNVDQGTVAIPFESWRNAARRFGLDPRMPAGELNARAARISDDATDWAWRRFAQLSEAHGATPIVLALDVVWDEAPEQIPYSAGIQAAGLPVINLFNVYPEAQRSALRVSALDVHANEAGHHVIADALYQKLLPVIAAKCADATPH
jgi:hypothetical protein